MVLPGDGHAVAVQQAGVEQLLHHDLHAAHAVDVAHHEPAGRAHVDEVRHACGAMRSKSSSSQVDVGLARDREQVQHGVGRAGERHHDGDRVLERLLGHDVARQRPAFGDELRQPAMPDSRAATSRR